MRTDIKLHPTIAENWPGEEPFLFAGWHNQQLLMPWIYLDYKSDKTPDLYAMVSRHADGRIIATILGILGIKSVAGSSSKGGKEAMQQQIDLIKAGNAAAITPDGPRGPIYKLKNGVIKLAQETGAPIYPVSSSCSSCWTFNSWDLMTLPKPFAKFTYLVGEAYYVPKDLSEEEFKEHVLNFEVRLNDLTEHGH